MDLLESGERNSHRHACATKHSSETDRKGPIRGNAYTLDLSSLGARRGMFDTI